MRAARREPHVGQHVAAVERAREAVGRAAWVEAYRLLGELDQSDLAPDDLDAFADVAWWLCRIDESIAVRQRAYAAHVASADNRRAGHSAWMLFYEHHVAGRSAVASGWLQRAQRHLSDEPECEEHGYLAYAESDLAHQRGDLDLALAAAGTMIEIGQRCHSADLVALGLQAQGGVLLSRDRTAEGLALLDEAMCAVLAGELSALVTGWVYCLALGMCMDAADLRRASEWTEAAMSWCESLPAGTPYHGLCRVHRVEVLNLRGAWAQAALEADRACDELLLYNPRVAAEAFYVAGEIRQRRGDLPAAERAYLRAHELGRDPQPGLALLYLAQGKAEASAAALRFALAGKGHSRRDRTRLLAAQVEVELAVDRVDCARTAADELESIAQESGTALLQATAITARGAVALAEHDPDRVLQQLQRARALWMELGLPYEAAQARMMMAAAGREAGDHEGAQLELKAAYAAFERLGSVHNVRRVAALLGEGSHAPAELTQREVQVLRLVAVGKTNRDIATELVISHHTVARHLNNIFGKLGVSSRAAATAYAFTHGLT
ncbi:MAG: LuxR family transcriptional regulator [Streptosporangiales bacterium]|nr:LuxR family transcriptional regulator [Streptosporangiales bacterium]